MAIQNLNPDDIAKRLNQNMAIINASLGTSAYDVSTPRWNDDGKSSITILREEGAKFHKEYSTYITFARIIFVMGVVVVLIYGVQVYNGIPENKELNTRNFGINLCIVALPFLVTTAVLYSKANTSKSRGDENFQSAMNRQIVLEDNSLLESAASRAREHEFRNNLLRENGLLLRQALAQPHQLLMKSLDLPGQLIMLISIAKAENKFELFRKNIEQSQAMVDRMTADINNRNIPDEEKDRQRSTVIGMLLDLTQKMVMS